MWKTLARKRLGGYPRRHEDLLDPRPLGYCRSRRAPFSLSGEGMNSAAPDEDLSDTLVLYLHSKGVFSGRSGEDDAIRRAMQWRRAMEHFVIWNWKDCVDALAVGMVSLTCF